MDTTTKTPNAYIWSTSASLVLCIAAPVAVYAGSQRSLKKHVCRIKKKENDDDIKSETDVPSSELSELSELETESNVTADAQSGRSRWTRWLKISAFFVAMISVGLGIGFGLPMIATPTILDLLWILFMTFQTGTLIRSAINTALPDPRVMEVRWTWNSITWTVTGPNPKSPVPNTKARLIVVSLLTMLVTSGVNTGHTWLMCIPVSAFVYGTVSCCVIPDRKFKNNIKWIIYLQVGLATFLVAVVGITTLIRGYTSSGSENEIEKPSRFSQPSPEVLAFTTMFQRAIPLIVPGVFVALGLRFDYAQASKTMGSLTPMAGPEVSSHSVSIPSFPRPIFKEGIKVYILQLMILTFLYGSSLPAGIERALPIAESLCMPVWPVLARQILVAKRLGIFQELMEYSETRVTRDVSEVRDQKEKENLQALEDIEKAALSTTERA